MDFVEADFLRHPIGDFPLVSRQHEAADTHGFQAGNGFF
jgi:hypothetical protein